MKQYLFILGFIVLFSGLYTSCKTDTLDTLHQNEVIARDKYVKNHNLANYKDVSGIYFKDSIVGTDTTMVRSGFKVMLNFNITLLDGTVVFSTEDKYGHNYEEKDFYVDVSNTIVNQSYVQQIAGLHVGLKKMRIGGRAFMVIPSEQAFKAVVTTTGYVSIPRFSTLLVKVFVKKGYSPAQLAEQQQQ
jgi:FKBP-type peptidyl-prolyl cis-trans isomerase